MPPGWEGAGGEPQVMGMVASQSRTGSAQRKAGQAQWNCFPESGVLRKSGAGLACQALNPARTGMEDGGVADCSSGLGGGRGGSPQEQTGSWKGVGSSGFR